MSSGKSTFVALLSSLVLTACEIDLVPYLTEQGLKQGALFLKTENIDVLLKKPGLSPQLEHSLQLTRETLNFANNELGLKSGSSYTRFIQLQNPWVTQVVSAARRDKLELYLFQYPILGGLPYKGFFEEADAINLEKKLQSQGYDTHRRGVEAFSSLGWMPDPLLSSMLKNDADLIELIFHELVHRAFYFSDLADFNEAFATWFAQKAVSDFLATKPKRIKDPDQIAKKIQADQLKEAKLANLVREILSKGERFYAQKGALERRHEYFNEVKKMFSEQGLNTLAAMEWNNALILSLSTYYEMIPLIDRYAQRENLNYKELLKRVREEGPSLAKKILEASGSSHTRSSTEHYNRINR